MIVRAAYPDEYLTTMLPAVDEVVLGSFEQFEPQFSKVFRMKTSQRSIEQSTEVTGLSTFGVVPEGKGLTYDSPLRVGNKTWIHLQYGLGFKASKIAMDDDKFAMISGLGQQLGKSAFETREVTAALTFNNAFSSSFPGIDGVSLINTAHPLANGSTQSNSLPYASDLDVISLQMLMNIMRRTRDHRGKLRRLRPQKLIVPPELQYVASELLKSSMRPDTANNTSNAFKDGDAMPITSFMVWDYLTDPRSWFLETDPSDTGLTWYDREKFNTAHGIDFETRSVKTAGWMRFSTGFRTFYGVAGAPSS